MFLVFRNNLMRNLSGLFRRHALITREIPNRNSVLEHLVYLFQRSPLHLRKEEDEENWDEYVSILG